MAFALRESDRHFLLSLLVASGVIIFWKGIWEGVGSLPILENPWVDLFVGLVVLTFTQVIFREFDPLGGLEKGVLKAVHHAHHHPKRHEFRMRYFDNVKKKEIEVSFADVRTVEKNTLSLIEKDREIFIPIHRVRSIHRAGKVVWKL